MNEFNSEVLVVVNGEVLCQEKNWVDAQETLVDHLDEIANPLNATVSFYSILGNVHSIEEDFEVKEVPGDLFLDDEDMGSSSEEYEITSGEFSGSKFDDKEELERFLDEKLKCGDIELDDVKEMDVVVVRHEEMTFSDADQGDPSLAVEVNSYEADTKVHNFGAVYVLATEAMELIDEASTMNPELINQLVQESLKIKLENASLVNVGRDITQMLEKEVFDEMNVLEARLKALREAVIENNAQQLPLQPMAHAFAHSQPQAPKQPKRNKR